jgi:hypothetical protein
MLSVTYAQCNLQTLVSRYAECCYAECRYAECHYAECRYAECRSAVYLPLTANIRLGWRLMTKTLAYYDTEFVITVKGYSRGLLRCYPTPWKLNCCAQCYKTFHGHILQMFAIR